MRNSTPLLSRIETLRTLLLAGACCAFLSHASATPQSVDAPLIKLTEPKLVGDSVATLLRGPVRIVGRVFSPYGVAAVHVGDRTTGAQVNARVDGSGGFAAELPLAPGRNEVLIMALDKKDGEGRKRFTLVVPGAEAGPPPVQVVPLISTVDRIPPGTGAEPPPSVTVAPATTPAGGAASGTISRERLLGGARPPVATPTPSTGARKVYAVVVGVSKYANAPSIQLRYSATDARAFADHLRSREGLQVPEDRLVRLLDYAATRDKIELELKRMADAAGPDDLILFYFSGHGVNDGNDNLSLLCHDVRNEDDRSRWATGLKQSVIMEAMRSSRCRNRVIVLDACRSGLVQNGGAGSGANMRTTGEEGLYVLTSSAAGESAYEVKEGDGGHGIFTHYLLRGLRGEADGYGRDNKDGSVDLRELRGYLGEKVNEAATALNPDGQHPTCQCAGGDDLVLGQGASSGASVNATGDEADAVQGSTKPGYAFVPLPEDPKKLEGVMFVNEQTGDQVSFYGVNLPNASVSARIKGEVFVCVAVQQGKTFVFQDRNKKNELLSGTFDMNPEWDRMTVRIVNVNDTVVGRTLRRIGVPKRTALADELVFAEPEQDQQLEVVRPQPGWTWLTGHLGDRVVDFVAEHRGDVLLLKDNIPPGLSTGSAIWDPNWNSLSGSVQFEDGSEQSFTVRMGTPPGKRELEERTYADEYFSGQDITFFNVHPEYVELRGTVGPNPIKCVCDRRGDVFRCRDNSGGNTIGPFRLLLKNNGQRLVGNVPLLEKGTLVVNMSRVY